jgi:hypothetical protein
MDEASKKSKYFSEELPRCIVDQIIQHSLLVPPPFLNLERSIQLEYSSGCQLFSPKLTLIALLHLDL